MPCLTSLSWYTESREKRVAPAAAIISPLASPAHCQFCSDKSDSTIPAMPNRLTPKPKYSALLKRFPFSMKDRTAAVTVPVCRRTEALVTDVNAKLNVMRKFAWESKTLTGEMRRILDREKGTLPLRVARIRIPLERKQTNT